MNAERLKILADFLEIAPEEKFSLRRWRRSNGEENLLDDDSLMDMNCGTTGCAVGWACAMPEFQAEGLSFERGFPRLKVNTDDCGEPVLTGWHAVRVFFGLTALQSYYLFSSYEYPFDKQTAQHVAARINDFILKGKA